MLQVTEDAVSPERREHRRHEGPLRRCRHVGSNLHAPDTLAAPAYIAGIGEAQERAFGRLVQRLQEEDGSRGWGSVLPSPRTRSGLAGLHLRRRRWLWAKRRTRGRRGWKRCW